MQPVKMTMVSKSQMSQPARSRGEITEGLYLCRPAGPMGDTSLGYLVYFSGYLEVGVQV